MKKLSHSSQPLLTRKILLLSSVLVCSTFWGFGSETSSPKVSEIPRIPDAPPQTPETKILASNALKLISSQAGSIKSIAFKVIDASSPKKSWEIFEAHDRFRLNYQSDPLNLTFFFNKDRTYFWNHASSAIIANNGLVPNCQKILDGFFYSPLSILQFAAPSWDLAALSKPETWKALSDECLYIGKTSVDGKDLLTLRIPDVYDPYIGEKLQFDVYFDEDASMVPMGWAAYDSEGYLVHKVTVVSSPIPAAQKVAGNLNLPTELKLWRSVWPGVRTINGKVVDYYPTETTIKFTNLLFNNVVDSDIDLDPSLGKYVREGHSGPATIPR